MPDMSAPLKLGANLWNQHTDWPAFLEAMLRAYLSKKHVEGVETGCAGAALGSEMPRQASEVRRAATRRIKEAIDLVARQLPDWGKPSAHEQALATLSTMVGALVLARAVDDPKLSDGFRSAALKYSSSISS